MKTREVASKKEDDANARDAKLRPADSRASAG